MSRKVYTERISFTIPKHEKDAIRSTAARLGVSMSELLRDVIMRPDAVETEASK